MKHPIEHLLTAAVHLKRAQAKSCSQVVAITAALDELRASYYGMHGGAVVPFDDAVARAEADTPVATKPVDPTDDVFGPSGILHTAEPKNE